MPAVRRARKKRARKRKTARRDAMKLTSLLLDMEEPLTDAIDYVNALHLIGQALILDHDDAGEPITAVSWMAAERLQAVKATWKKALNERRRERS